MEKRIEQETEDKVEMLLMRFGESIDGLDLTPATIITFSINLILNSLNLMHQEHGANKRKMNKVVMQNMKEALKNY